MSVPRGRATLAAALVAGGCFFALAGDGIRAYFTPDDMMNLYGALSSPLLPLYKFASVVALFVEDVLYTRPAAAKAPAFA